MILSVPICPYHFVRYHFVLDPFPGITPSHNFHKHLTLLIAKFANRHYAVQVSLETTDLDKFCWVDYCNDPPPPRLSIRGVGCATSQSFFGSCIRPPPLAQPFSSIPSFPSFSADDLDSPVVQLPVVWTGLIL